MKPKSIIPHLITAGAATFVAARGIPPISLLALTLLGGGLVAAAANAFNSYLDRDIDAMMLRTLNRPLPSGQVSPTQALIFGAILGFAGTLILSIFSGWAAALLALAALVYYVVVYTIWLKRKNYFGSIVGSGVGALSPVIGWVAVTHEISTAPVLLTAIVIFWTIPHFWALAVFRRTDYERAGLKILPSKGVSFWIAGFSLLTILATVLLALVADLSYIYLEAATFLGIGLMVLSLQMRDLKSLQTAWKLHRYSILYISGIFGAMIIDRIIFR